MKFFSKFCDLFPWQKIGGKSTSCSLPLVMSQMPWCHIRGQGILVSSLINFKLELLFKGKHRIEK